MLDWHIDSNLHRIREIQDLRIENPKVKTFFFRDVPCAKAYPGQFIMVWIPGLDEIPLCLSSINENDLSSVTVAEVGEATRALNMKKTGEKIGVRGPFGNHFNIIGERALVAGGGIGFASLMPLVNSLIGTRQKKISVVSGAKTMQDLLFLDRLKLLAGRSNIQSTVTTEDGSLGQEGVVTDAVKELIVTEKYDMIYTCGPEPMIRKMYLIAEDRGIPLQASLERNMRCAIGICGSCVIGKYRVCRDGPIFTSKQLTEVRFELGKFKYDFSGKKVPIDN